MHRVWRFWKKRYRCRSYSLPCYSRNTHLTIRSFRTTLPRDRTQANSQVQLPILEVTESQLEMAQVYFPAPFNTKSLTSFQIQGGMSVPSSPAPMSRSSSLNPSAFEREHYVRQILSKGLAKASCATLTADESSTLNEMISKYPDTTLELLEPDIQSFAGTIEFNPIIFRDRILPLLLSSPLSEESTLFFSFRSWGLMSRTYSTLTFLPPTLQVLETLSLLISAQPQILHDQSSQSARLVHEFLANAGRQLEALSAKQGERDKTSRQVRLVPSPQNVRNADCGCVYF